MVQASLRTMVLPQPLKCCDNSHVSPEHASPRRSSSSVTMRLLVPESVARETLLRSLRPLFPVRVRSLCGTWWVMESHALPSAVCGFVPSESRCCFFFFFFSPIGKIKRDMGCDCMSIIPALEAMRQADLELRISLVYTVRTRENPKVNETREETVRVHSRKQPAL